MYMGGEGDSIEEGKTSLTVLCLVPDDALEGDGGAGVHGAEAVGVRHRRHLRDHRSVNLEQKGNKVFVKDLIDIVRFLELMS